MTKEMVIFILAIDVQIICWYFSTHIRFFNKSLKNLKLLKSDAAYSCMSAFRVLPESWKTIAPCSPSRKMAVKHFWADAFFKHFGCCYAVRHALLAVLSCPVRFDWHELASEWVLERAQNNLITDVSPNNIIPRWRRKPSIRISDLAESRQKRRMRERKRKRKRRASW